MSSPDEVPLPQVRRAIERAFRTRSLRAVAKEVGLSAMGVRYFLDGRSPQPKTRAKLYAWYHAHAGDLPPAPLHQRRSALLILLDELPHAAHSAAAARMLELLDTLHREVGVPAPAWVETLRQPGAFDPPDGAESVDGPPPDGDETNFP